MRTPTPLLPLAAVLLAATGLAACASSGGAPADAAYAVPEGAVEVVRVQDNGDVVHEYRVQGQLRMVKVVPVRGPTYYLVDRNGDGRLSPEDGDVPATYYKLFGW